MDIKSPLATAFSDAGMGWAGTVVALGTTTTLASTTLCSLFGQPRIFYCMAKDGLLMKRFASVHPKTQVPVFGTLVSSAVAGVLAFFLDIDALSDMVSIGTLMAFCVVCLGILVLRYPNRAGGGVSTAATQVALMKALMKRPGEATLPRATGSSGPGRAAAAGARRRGAGQAHLRVPDGPARAVRRGVHQHLHDVQPECGGTGAARRVDCPWLRHLLRVRHQAQRAEQEGPKMKKTTTYAGDKWRRSLAKG